MAAPRVFYASERGWAAVQKLLDEGDQAPPDDEAVAWIMKPRQKNSVISPPLAPVLISLLNQTHKIDGFDCGEQARNAWLQKRAIPSQASDDARAYVAAGPGDDAHVIGFYAITTGSIIRTMLPGAMRRNAPDPVSCVLLAPLGVATSHQGQGLSITLVVHAMARAAKVAEIAGCRLFVVHPATSELVLYYRKFGFIEVETSPSPIMAMSMQKVRFVLAAIR